MEIAVVNWGGGSAGVVEVPDSFANRKYNATLTHQAVCANLSNRRQGTRAQKTRGEVSHSTRKLFRQKGTGRARGGMSSSPVRVGGGRAFPSRVDENFKQRLPRRMFRAAMAVMFSQLLREERLMVVKTLTMETPKTRQFVESMKNMNLNARSIVLVDIDEDDKVALSSRNIHRVRYCLLHSLAPIDLMSEMVVVTERALLAGVEKWS